MPATPKLRFKVLINRRLAELHKTQGWLASKMEMDSGYLSRLASGHIMPVIPTAYKIAAALSCTIEDLWVPQF